MIEKMDLWLIRVATVLAAGSGLVYAAMIYLLEPTDEWSVVNHPWQPHVQHLHILVVPLLVFAVAVVWRSHALNKQKGKRNSGRFSGWGLMLVFWPMVASGFLLQVSISESWRSFWALSHLICSLLWLAAAAGHVVVSIVKRRAAANLPTRVPIVGSYRSHAAGRTKEPAARDS